MRAFLLIQSLLAIRAAAAALPRGAITGERSSKVEAGKDRQLRGSITAAQGGEMARKLPVATDKKNRALQMGGPATGTGGPGAAGPQGILPTQANVPFTDDSLFDDAFWSDNSCKLITFNETFYFTAPVAKDATGVVGERYFFDNGLNRPDGSQVENVTLSGVCTRTRLSVVNATAAGAGICSWVIAHGSGNWSMAASGVLESAAVKSYGGSMAVTGGTGEMVSVMGEMDVWPMDTNGMLELGDIFDTSYGYYVNAIYGLLICPKPYQMTPVANTTGI